MGSHSDRDSIDQKEVSDEIYKDGKLLNPKSK
jgi:hypothetical protein